MTKEEKRYSLISVDTGDPAESGGVRTTRATDDGEETIVVSSTAPASDRDVSQETHSQQEQHSGRLHDDVRMAPAVATSDAHEPKKYEEGGDDEVPFKRMQAVIIISLIVVIAVFLVYFNFLR